MAARRFRQSAMTAVSSPRNSSAAADCRGEAVSGNQRSTRARSRSRPPRRRAPRAPTAPPVVYAHAAMTTPAATTPPAWSAVARVMSDNVLEASVKTASVASHGHGGSDHSRLTATNSRNKMADEPEVQPLVEAARLRPCRSLVRAVPSRPQGHPRMAAQRHEREPRQDRQRRQRRRPRRRREATSSPARPTTRGFRRRQTQRQPAGRAFDEQSRVDDREQQRQRPQRRRRDRSERQEQQQRRGSR